MPRAWLVLGLAAVGVASLIGALGRAALAAPSVVSTRSPLDACTLDGGFVMTASLDGLALARRRVVDEVPHDEVAVVLPDGGAVCSPEVTMFHALAKAPGGHVVLGQWGVESPGRDLELWSLAEGTREQVPLPCPAIDVRGVTWGERGPRVELVAVEDCFLEPAWWTWAQRMAEPVVGPPVAELGLYALERQPTGRWRLSRTLR